MKKTLKIIDKTRTLLFIIAGLLVAGILFVSCGGGGYGGGGGGMYGGGSMGTGPGFFSLTSPANNDTGVLTTPDLIWTPSSGAMTYDVFLSDDGGITYKQLAPAVMAPATDYQVGTPLTLKTVYKWYVTAHNVYGTYMTLVSTFTTTTM